MDKSWIQYPRSTSTYLDGLEAFMDFATTHGAVNGNIICPCPKCKLNKWHPMQTVKEHLIRRAFPGDYKFWYLHGERPSMLYNSFAESSQATVQVGCDDEGPMLDVIRDAFGVHGDDSPIEVKGPDTIFTESNASREFYELIEELDKPLYPNCKHYSKLSFLTKLYHIKCLHKISDNGMSMILELLHDAFPHAEITPSFYEAKKLISKIGLDYEKIDAWPNDCMLYWGDDSEKETCKRCNVSRYKQEEDKGDGEDGATKTKTPAKILRYFPLKPRLRRLFMSHKTAEHMKWHNITNNEVGKLRHPCDGEAWKSFDREFPSFFADPRNVCLALASDGFNPFGN